MAIVEGNNISFFRGTKEKLINNLEEMNDGDLAIATDEMRWYLVMIVDNSKTLVGIGSSSPDIN